jgi:hypothetical protein
MDELEKPMLSGEAAEAYLDFLFETAAAGVPFDAEKVSADAIAGQQGDRAALGRLQRAPSLMRVQAQLLKKRFRLLALPARRPRCGLRDRGRPVRRAGRGAVSARAPDRPGAEPRPGAGQPSGRSGRKGLVDNGDVGGC